MILSLLFAAQIAVSSPGTTSQLQPWVAVDAQQAVVVWLESGQVRFSRIRFDGVRLDNGRAVTERGLNPKIASNGNNFLIVWVDNSEAVGRFLKPDGTFVGEAFSITDVHSVDYAAVAWVGSRYVVAWSGPDAAAAEVNTGQSINTIKVFGTSKTIVGDLSIAPAGGNDAIIAYNTQDAIASFPITTTIWTILLRADMDTEPDTPHTIATKTATVSELTYVRTPRIAPHADGFFIGWTQLNGAGGGSYAMVTQVGIDGKPLFDPVMVGSSFGTSTAPDATITTAGDRVFSVSYPLLFEGQIDFKCGCVSKTILLNAPAGATPSFSNLSAAPLPKAGAVVAYEYVDNGQPRTFVQFLDVPPPPAPRTRPTRH